MKFGLEWAVIDAKRHVKAGMRCNRLAWLRDGGMIRLPECTKLIGKLGKGYPSEQEFLKVLKCKSRWIRYLRKTSQSVAHRIDMRS